MLLALDRLAKITPPDIALANKSIATSLLQISGIAEMTLPQLAIAFRSVQTTQGLPIIAAQTEAVPPPVAQYYINTFSQGGTGPNGTVTVADILGTAIGWNETGPLTNVVEILNTMNTGDLANSYSVMSDTVNGVYGDPVAGNVVIPTGPAAGTYLNANDAFWGIVAQDANANVPVGNTIGLIGWSQDEIANVITAYPVQTANLNTQWNSISDQMAREVNIQAQIPLDWANLVANSRTSTLGLIQGLPFYGVQTDVGGAAQLIEEVADQNQTGEAIVGVMRQGRNTPVLQVIGITVPTTIPDRPVPPAPQAPLWPPTN